MTTAQQRVNLWVLYTNRLPAVGGRGGGDWGWLFLCSVLAQKLDYGSVGFGFLDTRALIIPREQQQAFS